jgi:hypothetical protein
MLPSVVVLRVFGERAAGQLLLARRVVQHLDQAQPVMPENQKSHTNEVFRQFKLTFCSERSSKKLRQHEDIEKRVPYTLNLSDTCHKCMVYCIRVSSFVTHLIRTKPDNSLDAAQ